MNSEYEGQYQGLIENLKWQPDNNLTRNNIKEPLNKLVTSYGSLTKALTELRNDFSVNVLSQRVELPFYHEQKLIKKPLGRQAVIREVELQIMGESVVFARSILPLSLILKNQSGLADLGKKPLGHLLFKKGQIKVSKRQFCEINFQGKKCQARRTPYEYMGSTILVSEFFLPKIESLLK